MVQWFSGTGKTAIYAVLGAKIYDFHFLATDIDAETVAEAATNVNLNHLDTKIQISHQPDALKIFPRKEGSIRRFHFSMCNPPFYASEAEWRESSKSKKTTSLTNIQGTMSEFVCDGGELAFCERIIGESLQPHMKECIM